MRCAARLLVSIALLMALEATSIAIAADSPQRPATQNVRYRPRLRARAYRHALGNTSAAQQETTPKPPAKDAAAKADPPAVSVLLEVAIVEVSLKPTNVDSGVDLSQLGVKAKRTGATVKNAAINTLTGFAPPVAASDNTPRNYKTTSKKSGEKAITFLNAKIEDAIRAMESMGETRLTACPRLLILNKQLAEVQIGTFLGYPETTVTSGGTTTTYKQTVIGTEMNVRPSVSSDGFIHLDFCVERRTGRLNPDGFPRTKSVQVSANAILRDNMTLAICGIPRTEVLQQNESLSQQLAWIPGPLSWLGLLSYSYSLLPGRENVEHRQLVALVSTHIVRK